MARLRTQMSTAIWSDPEFTKLTQAQQQLYLLLASQPNVSMVGTIDYTPRRWSNMAADTTLEQIETAISELVDARFLVVDWNAELVLIKRFVSDHWASLGRNKNMMAGLWNTWISLANDSIQMEVVHSLPDDAWTYEGVKIPALAIAMYEQKPRSDQLEPGFEPRSEPRFEPRSEPRFEPVISDVVTSEENTCTSYSQVTLSTRETVRPPPPTVTDADAVMTSAATELAEQELDRRIAHGDAIANPAGYVRARTPAIRAQHQAAWQPLFDADPGLDVEDLVDAVAPPRPPPRPPDPLDGNAAAAAEIRERNARRDRGEACARCDDNGLWLDDDGLAHPCDHTPASSPHGDTPGAPGTRAGP